MRITLFQPAGLDRQNFFTASVPLFCNGRNERKHWEVSFQIGFIPDKCNRHYHIFRILIRRKSGHLPSFQTYPFNIHICIDRFICETLRFFQNRSVFRDQIMSAKNKILCGFAFSRTCINITAEQSCTRCTDKHLAVAVLSDCFIGG